MYVKTVLKSLDPKSSWCQQCLYFLSPLFTNLLGFIKTATMEVLNRGNGLFPRVPMS